MALAITLLAAGACYSDSAFKRCALQPSECPTPEVYQTSQWMTANDATNAAKCASQSAILKIPALGRCDSESERFICTSHASACRVDVAFNALDPDCTVLHDYRPVDTPFIRSFYGECVATEDGIAAGLESFAVWQFNECDTSTNMYAFDTADKFFAGDAPTAQCDKVKTGACVDSSDNTNFFCAVSSEVCSSTTGFSYLNVTQVEAQLSTTCKLCDTIPSPPVTRHVFAGACIVDSTSEFKRCALMAEHCDGTGEKFFSSKALETAGIDAANVCKTQEGLHQVRLGRCDSESDQFACVSDASGCTISQSFQANDDTCLLVEDKGTVSAFRTTHFGHCSIGEDVSFSGFQAGRENYCAWSLNECKDEDPNARPYAYGKAVPTMSGSDPLCQCDDVRTGACVSDANPNDSYCAVASSACDTGYTFFNVRALEDPAGPNKVCLLCQTLPSDLAVPTAAAPVPTTPVSSPSAPSAPTSAAAPTPTVSAPSPVWSYPVASPNHPSFSVPNIERDFENEIENDSLAAGAVIGIVLGVLISGCCFLAAYCMFRKKGESSMVDQVPKKGSDVDKTDLGNEEEGHFTSSQPSLSAMEHGKFEEDFIPQEDHSVN
ncbi:hypothetical protein FisN_26Hu170 [Fistulifera solaris]|jgi:hypothetical protein|uniref:Uncharacterized protein n=1 Tax=Fistulifera solaris TaxID=1519565 RepID=A0A1Z5JYH5_FISSO|nr:hypothetical protein FisN_26Hu170 [Fistulifera solaris]|eukprot:GAX18868.1 hypothetical protein FisN_26Hu170 [Fistulifera solaris]